MEEDVEIQLLLKSNEQILKEAAMFLENDTIVIDNEESEVTLGDEEQNEEVPVQSVLSAEDRKLRGDVENMIDFQVISCAAEKLSQNISDDESFDSEDIHNNSEIDLHEEQSIGLREGNYFINEIMADDEEEYRGTVVELFRNRVRTRNKPSKNKIYSELSLAQRLILKRDELLKNLESKLQQELFENEEKQRVIRESILSRTTPDSTRLKEPSFTRSFFKKFGMPYFEDLNGFTPPPNEDHKKKLERGELIVTSIPKVCYWIKSHKEMLVDAIKNSLVDENSLKLIKNIKNFKQNLQLASVENENNLIVDQITKCQNELRSLRSKSYLELVSKEDPNREYDWMKYSVTVFNGLHSPEECKRFWHVYLKPSINKAGWNNFEDLKLLDIVERMQHQDWDTIAKLLGTNRTAYQCLVHFQTRIQPKNEFSSGRWSKEEDNKLLSVINASKIGDFIPWSKVSSHMGSRTHSQIYQRWTNCLNPKLVKGKFTKEEDLLIVSGIEVFGVSYKELSSLMLNRTSNQLRERYERYLLPRTSKIGTWSLEEDQQLLQLVAKHGEQNWVMVAKDFKSRTRTQVRQRYSFIQRMMKTKPDWSIAKVKRIQRNNTKKVVAKTLKRVKKVKDEIDNVEKVFSLSKLESDTFRIEKLRELKDKILFKKFELKNKKKVLADSSEVNSLLIEYFKYHSKPPVRSKFCNRNDYIAPLNEILLMAKFFGHELQLPECPEEIFENPRLSHSLKVLLNETLDRRVAGSSKDVSEKSSCPSRVVIHESNNINYVPPPRAEDILMTDSWHTPPVNVTQLNFSEFFKRTVFDYSYGMHNDIWHSRLNRFSDTSSSPLNSEPIQLRTEERPFIMPPNLLTTIGLRSLMLCRTRLKRDGSEKGFAGNLYRRVEDEIMIVKNDNEIEHHLLDQFEDTMMSLFTWPRVLSYTSIGSTPIIEHRSAKVLRFQSSQSKKIVALIKNSDSQSCEDLKTVGTNPKSKRVTLKSKKKNELQNGIRCKRKMNLEHLLKNVKKEGKRCVKGAQNTGTGSRLRITRSMNSKSQNDASQKSQVKCDKSSVDSVEENIIKLDSKKTTISIPVSDEDEIKLEEISSVNLPKVTYTRPRKSHKSPTVSSITSEPVVKRARIEKSTKKDTTESSSKTTKRLSDSSEVESCLEVPLK